ncbi:hypothetical protein Pen01_33580 [Phytomonospora endophytica]|nr:hypothetical protein Pen01_33580 [Phytomonospora endophytica]
MAAHNGEFKGCAKILWISVDLAREWRKGSFGAVIGKGATGSPATPAPATGEPAFAAPASSF